ncbi:SDR family NAD(P)-dependent oxidoreductase [Clostridium felsineum]|uniref:Uncharacterized protein n=1 Tax=Clostridium felsineum TaxID=36839 RepID=A0A1S8KXN8_9CLOT|nr:SDR family NAD(P)-dependent oxidoreductase [Clostridium felsineum]URZ08258.1 hypothetical protein CLROS_036260 [Clostridium felsineum]URZ13289.1 hypothetical protein CROST_040410 [Clostridium felsineum]
MDNNKKTALITGATSGIGEEFARRFGKLGYDLIITGRRENKMKIVADEIKKESNVKVDIIIVELSDEKELENLIKVIENKRIDILVNNAGFGVSNFYDKEHIENFINMEIVHVKVPMRITYTVLKGMIERNDGVVINVSSESAFLPMPQNTVYASTKAFLKIFTEGLNLEVKARGKNIKFQALCPGFTKTDFHEKMGIEKSSQVDRGIIKWRTPKYIVDYSLKMLKKDKVICVPGIENRILIRLLSLLPKKNYEKLMVNFCIKSLKVK